MGETGAKGRVNITLRIRTEYCVDNVVCRVQCRLEVIDKWHFQIF